MENAEFSLSPLPAFPLPKNLRHPPNPPPTCPLPRPPSILENQQTAARLSASLPFPTPLEIKKSTEIPQHSHSYPFPKASDSPYPVGRRPSAHTQASSDALGENYLPSQPLVLPALDQNSRKSSAISTNCSRYSSASLSSSPEPNHASHFNQSVISLEELQRNPRLSRLSYISGSAAFVLSAGSRDLQTGDARQPDTTNNVSLGFGEHEGPHSVAPFTRGTDNQYEFHTNSTLGVLGDSRLRIHPADNRFEQCVNVPPYTTNITKRANHTLESTYRIRKASEAEDPIYVPVYSFEPPGKFPHRSRLTAPLSTPKFLNHTPRSFSLLGRSDGNPAARSSSDSAEMLLGNTSKFDGIRQEIKVPPQVYDAQRRAPRGFRGQLARGPPVLISDVPPRNQIKGSEKRFSKETSHQKFEREHGHYFHDLSQLEESYWPVAPILPRIQIHGPKHSLSKYGVPSLRRPEDSYTGKEINEDRWPERYKRQKRIGRSLLCVCIAMPPLWLIMAVGLLDNLVAEMTSGEIWGVGRSEKVLAAWFGGIFCFFLIATIIVVGIVVL
ncbi:hypothetical protein TWF718_006983 [Orbilia javanica]|uniref:Uncharacterized protein n=1 Tax=Orbilia javanica TaxID=47235 RepID=A0AAN8N244_9PEZI